MAVAVASAVLGHLLRQAVVRRVGGGLRRSEESGTGASGCRSSWPACSKLPAVVAQMRRMASWGRRSRRDTASVSSMTARARPSGERSTGFVRGCADGCRVGCGVVRVGEVPPPGGGGIARRGEGASIVRQAEGVDPISFAVQGVRAWFGVVGVRRVPQLRGAGTGGHQGLAVRSECHGEGDVIVEGDRSWSRVGSAMSHDTTSICESSVETASVRPSGEKAAAISAPSRWGHEEWGGQGRRRPMSATPGVRPPRRGGGRPGRRTGLPSPSTRWSCAAWACGDRRCSGIR